MNKTFRPWDVDQHHLFPPTVRDFVPEGHPAYFVREMVRVDLDLSAIYAAYDEARGYPAEASADAGYNSAENIVALEERGIAGYIATGRQNHGTPSATKREEGPPKDPVLRRMWARLRRGGWRSRYRLRKQTVEPVFGQIKEARGFRRFLTRGIEMVRLEWSLVTTAHNVLKFAAAR